MLDSLFRLLFRPRPKFRLGQFVERHSDHHPGCRYMMIRNMRFARPKGGGEKQWVYCGMTVRVIAGRLGARDEIVAVTKIFDVLEKHLEVVDGLEPL